MPLQRRISIRLDLPREALAQERAAMGPMYHLGPAEPLPLDPDAADAPLVEPVTLVATITIALLAERLVRHWLARHGEGVMIDARDSPPRVSQMAGVPQGFVALVHADGKAETMKAEDPATLADLLGRLIQPA